MNMLGSVKMHKNSRRNYFTLSFHRFDIFRSNKKAKLLNAGSTNGSSIAASSDDSQSRYGGSVHAANGSAANGHFYGYSEGNKNQGSNGNGNGNGNGGGGNYHSHPNQPHYATGQPHQYTPSLYGGGSSAEDHYELTQQQQQIYGETHLPSGQRTGGPNLVNKQLVLPFVPPSFPNKSQDGVTHLIKPSEYLKSISIDKVRAHPPPAPRIRRTTCRYRSPSSRHPHQHQHHPHPHPHPHHPHQLHGMGEQPPLPPPPPPLPHGMLPPQPPMGPPMGVAGGQDATMSGKSHKPKKPHGSAPNSQDTATRKQHQPLSAISIQDLNSQLRRTDTQKVPKPYQMPARSLSMQCLTSSTETYLKSDLIAELKISKDIPGIKKMKVEQQMASRMDSEHYMEITKQFSGNNYVDQIYLQIPERDQAGNAIPDWKRQMMAKKAAERAKKDFEERMAQEAESRRLSQIPQWKRDLLARREETENKLKAAIYTPKVEENNRVADTWRLKNRAMSIDNININLAGMEQHYQQIQFQQKQQQLQLGNKENHVDPKGADQDQEHGVGIGSALVTLTLASLEVRSSSTHRRAARAAPRRRRITSSPGAPSCARPTAVSA
uniref:Small forked protein n=1 Tax=Drosophila melanogaster TaxID=7227 RepID=Q24340_DROME|nr:small forked protein [Drosophila melanogaster]prf//2009379A forked gene [Drosophila melanogaster]